ncbi:peptide deformylase [Selenomonas artemidis]|uniref:peptide deformylase n=1 Tax=Selenomonas artemidis TaxID=671224 RepID=UPI0003FAFA79|nr:peptide deformylase [Selenomonas artemidis]
MAVLEIKKAGDPVLKQVAEPIDRLTKRHRQLLDDMAETMYAANGVGLAAPQIGKSIRMVVIDVEDEHGLLELINPVITMREGTVVGSEGCLSVPKMFGDVERAARVTVEYTDRRSRQRSLTAEGLLARCIQHECDHLDGRLFIDIAVNLHKEEEKG